MFVSKAFIPRKFCTEPAVPLELRKKTNKSHIGYSIGKKSPSNDMEKDLVASQQSGFPLLFSLPKSILNMKADHEQSIKARIYEA